MAVTEIGHSGEKTNDILFRTYSYQNGKGQEKVYYAKDTENVCKSGAV